jgi:iron complex transport system ATP-binding protein
VTRDPVTDAPLVTAVPERPAPTGSVHVVGGGGAAAPLLFPLRAAGLSVSVGAVPRGDRDAETARALGADVVTAPPFEPLADAVDAVADRVEAADVTVVADVDLDPGVRPLLETAADAASLVVVDERPLGARAPEGGDCRDAYRRLLERGVAVDGDDVPEGDAAAAARLAARSKGR